MALSLTRYPIEVFWSDEGEGYVAFVPELAGCNAWGKTKADAIHEVHQVHDAIAAWIKTAKNMKRAIPNTSGSTPPRRPRA